MNLNNRIKKRKIVLTYDKNRLIKIGEKELYHFVYEHIWDLTMYDSEVLNKYELEKSKYVYCGQSKSYNLRARSSKRRYDVEKNKNQNKDVTIFLRKYERFLSIETRLIYKEIREELYYNSRIVTICESKSMARLKELEFNAKYHYLDFNSEILEQHMILLSKEDYPLHEVEFEGTKALQLRPIAKKYGFNK